MKINKGILISSRNPINTSLWRRGFILIALVLCCFALSQTAQAVKPPDGGYTGQNTAEGTGALFSLTTGLDNTAVGFHALYSITDGSEDTATGSLALANDTGGANTAYGFSALYTNTTGQYNTAMGRNALFSNTTGYYNTATGGAALAYNTTGVYNTATGRFALYSNTEGAFNTANGTLALYSNTTGGFNTATGREALYSNSTGDGNAATGDGALYYNTTGGGNTGTGNGALADNTTGNGNTANGSFALFINTTGSHNIAVGDYAGINVSAGDNDIYIGNPGPGSFSNESNAIRIGTQTAVTDIIGGTHAAHKATFIAGISGVAVTGSTVVVGPHGKLGVAASSARFKEAIKPMDKASETILALRPVTFQYKKEIDPDSTPQFGLVAEEVAKVNPALVSRDADGKVFTVRYDAVNAMLLNEFLKEHRAVQELRTALAQQEAQIRNLVRHQQRSEIRNVSHSTSTAPRLASSGR